jgi:hypothetical protein
MGSEHPGITQTGNGGDSEADGCDGFHKYFVERDMQSELSCLSGENRAVPERWEVYVLGDIQTHSRSIAAAGQGEDQGLVAELLQRTDATPQDAPVH